MKLLSLALENFMGLTGQHELALDGLGLVHVAGRNEDDPGNNSNGSGKSTVLEALTWGLFGEGLPRPQGNSEQGIRADEVLNDRLGKQCKVIVSLADGDQSYTIERWRKWKVGSKGRQSTGVKLAIDGDDHIAVDEKQALDEKETNRLICQALGITHEIWCRGVVFGQESSFNFCDATNKARTDILTTVMGLEEIDQWLEKCRDEKRALTNKMAECGGKLEILRSALIQAEANDPQKRHDEWDIARSEAVRVLVGRKNEITEQGKSLKAQLDAMPVPQEIPAPNHQMIPPPNISAIAVDDADVQRAKEAADQAQSAFNIASAEAHRTQGSLQAAQVALDQLDRFHQQASCPTCGQAITAEHKAVCRAEAHRVWGQANSVAATAQAASEAAEQASVRARSVLSEAAAEYQAAYQDSQAEIRRLQQQHQDQVQAQQQIQQQYQQQVQAQQKLGRDRSQVEQQLAVMRADWASIDQQIQAKLAEQNPHGAAIAEHQASLETARRAIATAEQEQRSIGHALEICIWWEKELPRFRTWMFDSIVDVLAAEANRWLGVMSGGVIWIQITTAKQVAKRLKDELDVQIYRWQPDGSITCRPYRVWSGGEKRRVSLAVDLGLSRLMAQRASKAYRFIALDEVDRHLDDRGKDGLRQVLDELRAEKDTCLTITHDPSFRASFDTEILVTKARGQTQMEIRDAGQQGDHDRGSPQTQAAESG
jgi:DNA repair exonuclease SbcCD ATPase subunit